MAASWSTRTTRRALLLRTTSIYTAPTPPRLSQCPSRWPSRRAFQTSISPSRIPDFAFAFDIDGVLVRSSTPVAGAHRALSYLQAERIPFILLTNGGGKAEEQRVADLSDKLGVPLDASLVVQSHTPFAEMTQYHDKNVLIVGGDHDNCQHVARKYGFANAVTPGDILCAHPDIWPFARQFLDFYRAFAKPLPPHSPDGLKIDAIFVYNDPRDWGLDATVMLDLLLSRDGVLGTLSPKNGDRSLPNGGYQQDGQPRLYYSNSDLWWAASYHLNRLGQGGFQAAFEGLWAAVTAGAALRKTLIGKPHQPTYEFAERRLSRHRKYMYGHVGLNDPLRRVYMVGDNPESDIRGANNFNSPQGSQWTSILVKTGVYQDGTTPSCEPHIILNDVWEAVQWAVDDARKHRPLK